jgi:hypothetical protein
MRSAVLRIAVRASLLHALPYLDSTTDVAGHAGTGVALGTLGTRTDPGRGNVTPGWPRRPWFAARANP